MALSKTKKELNYEEYNILKILCTNRELNGNVKLSSSEIGQKVGVSQQTASRVLIMLEKHGYINRIAHGRRQYIAIQEKGYDALYEEMAELSEILGIKQELELRGTITSGLGEGRYYVSKKPYVMEFTEKLGIIPYPGTLNVKILPEEESKLRTLRARKGIIINGFQADDRTYGDVLAFPCKFKESKCAAIFPIRSVYRDVIEIISNDFLREKYSLSNDDRVSIYF